MSRALVDGALFAQRYRVVRCIATGGMGSVYEVVHLGTHRHRALKVMHPHLFQSPEMRERFQREARVAAEIQSEYVVDVFDTGVDDATGLPFLVMELLEGEDLRHHLARVGRLTPEEVVTYLVQVAAALDKSHAVSIVHRDLKPENIFLSRREDDLPLVKILDFGVAKVLAENTAALQETQGVGTPLFMPPEQLNGEGPITSAADIYSLGMVAYMLLVGESYWARELKSGNPYHFMMIAAKGVKESATARAADRGVVLPPPFDAWFGKVTSIRPGDRFQRAGDAVLALEKALSVVYAGPRPKAITARPPPVVSVSGADLRLATNAAGLTSTLVASTTTKVPWSRSPLLGALVALLLCALGGGILGFVLLQPSMPAPAASAVVAAQAQPVEPLPPPTPAVSAEVVMAANETSAIKTTPLPTKPLSTGSKTRPSTKYKKPSLDQLLGQH